MSQAGAIRSGHILEDTPLEQDLAQSVFEPLSGIVKPIILFSQLEETYQKSRPGDKEIGRNDDD